MVNLIMFIFLIKFLNSVLKLKGSVMSEEFNDFIRLLVIFEFWCGVLRKNIVFFLYIGLNINIFCNILLFLVSSVFGGFVKVVFYNVLFECVEISFVIMLFILCFINIVDEEVFFDDVICWFSLYSKL